MRARRFSTIVYYLVYHPLLWWLSRFEGWHVLHAGAVAENGRAHVLAGLPGCGKSTLTVGALGLQGFDMMSDNLLLTNGTHVRACPEALLLDEKSLTRVGPAAGEISRTGDRHAFGRRAYECGRLRLDALEPGTIHLLSRARRPATIALDRRAATTGIEAGNWLAKEVRRCRIMAEVLDLVAGTDSPDERAIMWSLTSRAPCFETRICAGDRLADVIRRMVCSASR